MGPAALGFSNLQYPPKPVGGRAGIEERGAARRGGGGEWQIERKKGGDSEREGCGGGGMEDVRAVRRVAGAGLTATRG